MQGILFAQVVNFPILKVTNIAIFAAKVPFFKKRIWICLPSQFSVSVCNGHKSRKLTVREGNNRENTWNLLI